MASFIVRNREKIVLGATVCVLIFMHFFLLTQIPYGMNVDEAGAAYDAYCISRFGVDRWLMKFPIYFMNYGDGQNALNTYLMALLFKLTGSTGKHYQLIARIPIAVASLITGLSGYLFMQDKERKWQSKLWLILYTIMPIFVMTQRFGLESHLMLCASATVFACTSYAIRTDSVRSYLLLGTVMGLTLYTYALSYLVIPLYLAGFLVCLIRLKKWSWKHIFSLVVPLGLLAFPLMLCQIVNMFQLPSIQLGPVTIPHLNRYRSNELSLNPKNMWNSLKLIFHSTLFFDNLPYNTLSRYGTLYYVSLPFLAIGFCEAVKETVSFWKNRKYPPRFLCCSGRSASLSWGVC